MDLIVSSAVVSHSKFSPIASVSASCLLKEFTSSRNASTEACSGSNEAFISVVMSFFILARWFSSKVNSCCIVTGSFASRDASSDVKAVPEATLARFPVSKEVHVVQVCIPCC